MMDHRYHINTFWSKDDEAWIAHVPDLRGCSAHGDTPEEAMREVQIAIGLWLDVAREDGDPIPEPRYRPAIYAAAE
jgi:predicted RNase H-like HicB family nuclease